MPATLATFGWNATETEPRTAQLTMERMRELVLEDIGEPEVFETGAEIIRNYNPIAFEKHAAAIGTWLRRHTHFVRDPDGLELLRTPRAMLAEIDRRGVAVGDCDDVAMLGAAIGKSVGFRAKFVAESYLPPPAQPFQHVYTVLSTPGGWRALDVQRGDVPTVNATRRLELAI